jgi:hypothetical protein
LFAAFNGFATNGRSSDATILDTEREMDVYRSFPHIADRVAILNQNYSEPDTHMKFMVAGQGVREASQPMTVHGTFSVRECLGSGRLRIVILYPLYMEQIVTGFAQLQVPDRENHTAQQT